MTSIKPGVTFPIARKAHKECEICLKPIEKGEKYIRIVFPPWEGDVDVDVDDYGKYLLSFINTHKWEVHKTHEACEIRREQEEYAATAYLGEAEGDIEDWEDTRY